MYVVYMLILPTAVKLPALGVVLVL